MAEPLSPSEIRNRIYSTRQTIRNLSPNLRVSNADREATRTKLKHLAELIKQYESTGSRILSLSPTLGGVSAATVHCADILARLDTLLTNCKRDKIIWKPDGKARLAKLKKELDKCTLAWSSIVKQVGKVNDRLKKLDRVKVSTGKKTGATSGGKLTRRSSSQIVKRNPSNPVSRPDPNFHSRSVKHWERDSLIPTGAAPLLHSESPAVHIHIHNPTFIYAPSNK